MCERKDDSLKSIAKCKLFKLIRRSHWGVDVMCVHAGSPGEEVNPGKQEEDRYASATPK